MPEENAVAIFEEKSLALMKQLSALKRQKEELEAADEKLISSLKEFMDQYGITSFKNDYVTISNVGPSESVSVDLKKLQEKEPECYQGLIEDYPKVTKKAGYVRIIVK